MSSRLIARAATALLATLLTLPAHSQPGPAARMRTEAEALIGAVDARSRAKLVLAFTDEKRVDWHYTPRSRPGLSFADMDARQREAVHRLLGTALSVAGHRKLVNVIELELVLRELETFGLLRDPEKYFVVFFGAPDARARRSTLSASPGPARPNADGSTTTACRARNS